MDHNTIHEQELIRRYVQGRLDGTTRERFEDHFIGCAACQDAVTWETELHTAMRDTAADDIARVQQVASVGLFAWLARQSALQRGLVLAATFVIALGPLIAWQRERSAHRDTMAKMVTTAEVGQRADAGTAAPSTPGINTPLFYLDTIRGDAVRDDAEQVNRLPAPGPDSPAILVMELDDTGFADHRAVLERNGEVLWQQAGLVANPFGAFVVTLPPGYLTAGPYSLRLEGLRDDGTALAVGRYRFDVVP